ncbi:hypothetical protein Y1Q_0002420 [Alligator mississippiensis]|uniref:Uncharacterized protein n=1 Tax=Alligator mississippiensis TaxID=8496 RepID=A0A151N6B9_ALLMI|nr:hypothetical protein Y1Q_0002420 [Alligator mississippiensis]
MIGFVDNDAFSRNYAKNRFNFKHYNINFVAIYADGEQTLTKPLQLDFENASSGLCSLQKNTLPSGVICTGVLVMASQSLEFSKTLMQAQLEYKDDEAEEVDSQEEAHAADTSSTATETQEHAEPASMGSGSCGPVSEVGISTATHGRDFHSRQ